jgi:hypothetical protein
MLWIHDSVIVDELVTTDTRCSFAHTALHGSDDVLPQYLVSTSADRTGHVFPLGCKCAVLRCVVLCCAALCCAKYEHTMLIIPPPASLYPLFPSPHHPVTHVLFTGDGGVVACRAGGDGAHDSPQCCHRKEVKGFANAANEAKGHPHQGNERGRFVHLLVAFGAAEC